MHLYEEIFVWKKFSDELAVRLSGFRNPINGALLIVRGNFLTNQDSEVGLNHGNAEITTLVDEFLETFNLPDSYWQHDLEVAVNAFFERNKFAE